MKKYLSILVLIPAVASAQSDSGAQVTSLSESKDGAIERIEALTGQSIFEVLESEFPGADLEKNTPAVEVLDAAASKGSLPESFYDNLKFEPVDYGYIVKDQMGGVVDVFGPNTPTFTNPSDPNSIFISGYGEAAEFQVTRVGAAEYNEALKNIAIGLGEAVEEAAGRGGRTIAQKAQKATTLVAAETCPNGYYPTEIKLFLDAGFDFVVVNSQTGSELTLLMSEVCDGFYKYLLSVEQEKVQALKEAE